MPTTEPSLIARRVWPGTLRARCCVCGEPRNLTRTVLEGPYAHVCPRCLDAALRLVAEPVPSTINRCSGRHDHNDDRRFNVVAVWPLGGFLNSSEPTIRACPRHLTEALDTLAERRATA
ncbi:hypothetical protein GCM10010420_39330 [Streptomyces glaucosporus]|uniref:ATP-dependent Clp protease ATP-binding subunit ClpX zinc ribbon domain-containing protein n=1 Tax=Streptomyces glaucosporus TaxID=284044 RepID=A0ABP5VMY8_9ACTN